ncbi:MAG: T9SS type A sorting domain-containing protein [Ignavibacteriales bacterium]|nr:T9SS type A sorting domain-containing protein [Ignavibacteriales bacterium]
MTKWIWKRPSSVVQSTLYQGAAARFIVLSWIFMAGFSAMMLAQNCSKTSTGLKPLSELRTDLYFGYQGGLYPNGLNEGPAAHNAAGIELAQSIVPLNASGAVEQEAGSIVLLSIGMSNATQEFSLFKSLADQDPAKNTKLVIVDGAQGGQTASIISNPSANFWSVIDQRLTAADVTREQVQVAWVKEANANPTQSFPQHAVMLQGHLESIARILKARYPNIKLAYWSSRTYGGYATTTLNPEPYAYESGFAVKWLIAKQIENDTSLVFQGSNARAPWLAWGPYLWADGTVPRSDGFSWDCADFQSDGTHPSTSGRQKVANALLSFFKTNPTTTAWFLKPALVSIAQLDYALPESFVLNQNFPNPFNPSTTITYQIPHDGSVSLRVFNVLGKEVALLVEGTHQAGEHRVRFDASALTSGAYFYRLRLGNLVLQKTMIILK